MKKRNLRQGSGANIANTVKEFYEKHPYPPPVENLDAYSKLWSNPNRQRTELNLYCPDGNSATERTILVAGCGTSQAAKHAMRWPQAKVIGVDVSITSIRKSNALKQKYKLQNLTLQQMPIERVDELGIRRIRLFAQVFCTTCRTPTPDCKP